MGNRDSLLSRISSCMTDRPYIFISYSSKDCEAVWQDVLNFQEHGYNVWLDKKNLDCTKESWKNDALTAIQDPDCKLMVFYLSASSLRSQACLNELRETISKETLILHGRNHPVSFIAVEVEPVYNMPEYVEQTREKAREELDKPAYGEQAKTIYAIFEEFFNTNNERTRIPARAGGEPPESYYAEIMRHFPEETRIVPPAQRPSSIASPVSPAQPEESWNVPAGMETVLELANSGDLQAADRLVAYFIEQRDWASAQKWLARIPNYGHADYAYGYVVDYWNAHCSWMLAKKSGSWEDWWRAYECSGRVLNGLEHLERLGSRLDKTGTDLIWRESYNALKALFDGLLNLAGQGDPQAQYELACQYLDNWERAIEFSYEFKGGTCRITRNRARKWLSKAAESGHEGAIARLSEEGWET